MDKNVDPISDTQKSLVKSQYGQKRRLISLVILVWTKTQMISIVNLSIDKKIIVNLSMDKNVEDILSKSQYGQKGR